MSRDSRSIPIPGTAAFPRNAWYVATLSDEITDIKGIHRVICGEPLFLYRNANGEPVVLYDMCPHRGLPLSAGKLIGGGRVRCGYHGFEFGADGRCVRMTVPGRIPATLRTRAYPAVERWKWIWVWPGDPDRADPSLIPDHADLRLTEPGWSSSADFVKHWPGNYLLQLENSSDNLHLNFVHEGLVDDGRIGAVVQEVQQEGRVVTTRAALEATPGVPIEQWWGFDLEPDQLRDREVVTKTYCPSLGHFQHSIKPHGVPDAPRQVLAATLAITPETERTHWVFYGNAINFTPRVRPDSGSHIETLRRVLEQDVECFRAIQDVVDRFGVEHTDVSVRTDERCLRARRIIGEMLAAERRDNRHEE